MIANRWYSIAQTTVFDTSCSISITFGESSSVLFTASVKYGVSSLNISSCKIEDGYNISVRLRETESKWCVDLLSDTEITPDIVVADSPYWTEDNSAAGSGAVIAVIENISKEFNTTTGGGSGEGGESLFERVNVGTDTEPVFAVIPKDFNGRYVHIFSKGGVSSGGFSGTQGGGGGGATTLGGLNNVDDNADNSTYVDQVLIKQAYSTSWKLFDVASIVGLDTEALKVYLDQNNYVQEDDLKPYDERIKTLEDLGFILEEVDGKKYVRSQYNLYSDGGISSGGIGGEGGSTGGGSTVSYTPIVTEKDGQHIGIITIDGLPYNIYAPKGVTVEDLLSYATKAELTTLNDTVTAQIAGKADKTEFETLRDAFNALGLKAVPYEINGETKYYLESSLDFYSKGGVSSGGMNPSSGGGTGGGSTVSYIPTVTDGELIGALVIDGLPYNVYSPSLAAYAKTADIADVYATKASLDSYAKSKDIADTYATKTALNDYATTTALGTAIDNITTLQGYFKDGIAKEAAKVSKSLKFGSKTYNGSAEATVTADDLGALTSHQTIYKLTFESGTFSAGSFTANSADKTIKIPTTTSHISEGDNKYYTNARVWETLTGSTTTAFAANRALITNANGKVVVSAITATELGYLDNVTSNVQTQINGVSNRVTSLENMFEWDGENIKAKANFYSVGGISSGGNSTTGGGSGSGSTVSYAQTISNGIALGTLTIDGVTTKNTIYAPSALSAYTNDVGYIKPNAAGKLDNLGYIGINKAATTFPIDVYSATNGNVAKFSSNDSFACAIFLPSTGNQWSVGANNANQFYFYSKNKEKVVAHFEEDGALYATSAYVGGNALLTAKSAAATYLPLSGGTLESGNADTLIIRRLDSGNPYITFYNNSTFLGRYGFNTSGEPIAIVNSSLRTLIHSGNIGEQSVANAETLGGKGESAFARYSTTVTTDAQSYRNIGYGTKANGFPVNGGAIAAGSSGYGMYLHGRNGTFSFNTLENGVLTGWKTVAFTDSNVASATKLNDNTAYTAWGKTFFENGVPKNVSGDLWLRSDGSDADIGSAYSSSNKTMYNRIKLGAGETGIEYYSGSWTSGNVAAHKFFVGNTAANALTIMNNGNILIGATTNSGNEKVKIYDKAKGDLLELNSGSDTTYAALVLRPYNSALWSIGAGNDSTWYLYNSIAQSIVFSVNANGGLTLSGYTANTAFNDRGVLFGGTLARIGVSSVGGLGIYATEGIYLRTNSGSANSGIGVAISKSGDVTMSHSLSVTGNIGINKTNPTRPLDIKKDSTSDGDIVSLTSSAGWCNIVYASATSKVWSVGANADSFYWWNSQKSGTVAYIDNSGNFYTTGGVTSGSDSRYKTRIKDVSVDIETIAKAPLFVYKWANREDDKLHLGTTAQYWLDTEFKNAVVPTTDEKLWTMSYGEIAMGNTIVLARKAMNHEERISALEKENEMLKQELNKYRRA